MWRDGFAVNPLMHQTIAENLETYRSFPSSAAIYLKDGEVPPIDSRFRFIQADLDAMLQFLADEGRAASAKGDRIACQHMPFGTPDGDVQTQVMLQALMNPVVRGNGPQEVVEARVCELFLSHRLLVADLGHFRRI